jgi:glycosyltransferase involved in cell wall biosynthesis
MGFGNCVLVRDGRANVEVIGDGGATFEGSREVESLVEQLERLAGDEEAVLDLRRRALARVRAAYSWDGVADRYEALFQEIAC